jgi:hypothetical protein
MNETIFQEIEDTINVISILQFRERAFREDFAHRLNTLEKLRRELYPSNPNEIENILNILLNVLCKYRNFLQNILGYTKSNKHSGIIDFEYDSLSRLKLSESIDLNQ